MMNRIFYAGYLQIVLIDTKRLTRIFSFLNQQQES